MNRYENSPSYALDADMRDILKNFRQQFYMPHQGSKTLIYFCGNSLGLQPKNIKPLLNEELSKWGEMGVEGHFKGKRPWMEYHKLLKEPISKLVGAMTEEVVSMNALSVNLHLLLVSFYRPEGKRTKLIIEGGAFPSDQYAVQTQLEWHGLKPEEHLIELSPRQGEHCLRTEDIESTIAKVGDELALVMLGGVNYYTGQFFNLQKITAAAHAVGALAGFDLAHAIGNLPLQLHQWNVDFATWCSYKYLNSGPGGISGIYVHQKHGNNKTFRFGGWWGHNEAERFEMRPGFEPMPGADGWQLANAQILPMAAHLAALRWHSEAGMDRLREKSIKLTGYLEFLLNQLNIQAGKEIIDIITPSSAAERGCQLSVKICNFDKTDFDRLTEESLIVDWREPNVVRFAPVPLYNTFTEVYTCYTTLKKLLL
jgi:kynureninase